MTRFLRIGLLVTALATIASACGANASTTSPGDDGAVLYGKTFLSTEVTVKGKPHALVTGSRITLTFDKENGLSAQGSCNGVGGAVKLADGKIDLERGPSTLMACEAPLQKQNEWLAKVLTSKPSWTLDEGTLTITSDTTVLTFLDKKLAMPDIGLEDSRWTLDSVISHHSIWSEPGMEKAYLRFKDGKVEGFDGCNTLGGTATVSGSQVVLGDIVSTLKLCEDTKDLGARFAKVITKGTLTVAIDADQLTLTTADDKHGLVLRGSYGRPRS